MRRFLLILLLLCFSVAIYADRKEQLYNQAKTEMSQGEYQKALDHLNRLVELNNKSTNYRDVAQMKSECELQIKLDEKYREAKKQIEQKKYEQARENLRAVKKDSKRNYPDVDQLITQCENKIREAELARIEKEKEKDKKKSKGKDNPVGPSPEGHGGDSISPSTCQGYACLYNDYYNKVGGDWRLQWFTVDFHGLTTVGDNISLFTFRWKPVEVSLLNFNFDYVNAGRFSFNLEPIVRGYLPVSKDGKWSVYAGMGAHISLYGGQHSFLCELGAEINWSEKYASRMFFKYNGGVALGMSFSMGQWFNKK
ncbi:MAG: hypothetical protein IK073_05895 [Paludibacteraceae bacterium]|nr:hypothetical protein [Paludibacteraceae bacterium]